MGDGYSTLKTPQKAGVNHMSNKMMGKKRKDPMVKLIVVAVLMVLLTAGCFIGGYLVDKLGEADMASFQQVQQEVRDRNEAKKAQYELDVEAYKAKLNQSNQVNEAWPAAKAEGWDIIDLTNYPLEYPGKVTVNRADIMNNGLLLVNEWHSRPDDFSEEAVVSVAGYARNDKELSSFVENNTCRLFPQAIDAFMAALKDAKALGLTGYVMRAGSTYRTYEDQYALFQKEVDRQRRNHPNYSDEKVIERAKANYNYPGTSEYNTGLAFNLFLYEKDNATLNNAAFYETAQGKWLYENCWKYGLVFRFPISGYPMADTTDKTYKHGVSSNLNIYRYVGVANAEIMHHLDLCLEEYIEYLQEHTHVAVFEDGVKKYELTYQKVGDEVDSFAVEINRITGNYTMYLDNMGGVITVYSY